MRTTSLLVIRYSLHNYPTLSRSIKLPKGPSLNPARTYVSEYNVVQVGDAAGIANRFSGKGMSQSIHSSYLMASLAAQD